MKSITFTNVLIVISVSVTFAARLTDDQIAQIFNGKLDRGSASDSLRSTEDIAELERKILTLERLEDVADQILDSENEPLDLEEVLISYNNDESSSSHFEDTRSLEHAMDRHVPSLHMADDAEQDNAQSQKYATIDESQHLPTDTANVRKQNLQPFLNDLDENRKRLFSKAVNLCMKYVFGTKERLLSCLKDRFRLQFPVCLGDDCNKTNSVTNYSRAKKSLICGRYGCNWVSKKRTPYGSKENTQRTFKVPVTKSLLCGSRGCRYKKSSSNYFTPRSQPSEQLQSFRDNAINNVFRKMAGQLSATSTKLKNKAYISVLLKLIGDAARQKSNFNLSRGIPGGGPCSVNGDCIG